MNTVIQNKTQELLDNVPSLVVGSLGNEVFSVFPSLGKGVEDAPLGIGVSPPPMVKENEGKGTRDILVIAQPFLLW